MYAAVFFHTHPGWLLSLLPDEFDCIARTLPAIKAAFRAYVHEQGRFVDTENLIADVWQTDDLAQLRRDLKYGLPGESDFRLEVGPRGGIRITDF